MTDLPKTIQSYTNPELGIRIITLPDVMAWDASRMPQMQTFLNYGLMMLGNAPGGYIVVGQVIDCSMVEVDGKLDLASAATALDFWFSTDALDHVVSKMAEDAPFRDVYNLARKAVAELGLAGDQSKGTVH